MGSRKAMPKGDAGPYLGAITTPTYNLDNIFLFKCT